MGLGIFGGSHTKLHDLQLIFMYFNLIYSRELLACYATDPIM